MVGITAVLAKHAVTTGEVAMIDVQMAFLNTYCDAMQFIKKKVNVIQISHEPSTIPLNDAKIHEVRLKEINIDVLKLRRDLKGC